MTYYSEPNTRKVFIQFTPFTRRVLTLRLRVLKNKDNTWSAFTYANNACYNKFQVKLVNGLDIQ